MSLLDTATAFWRLGDPLTSDRAIDALGYGNDLYPYLRPKPVKLDFRIGSNNAPTQQTYGALSKWGKWNRLLTSGEKSALYAAQSWPFGSTPSLTDAVAFYNLDEATGSSIYADATGRGNYLIPTGAPTQTTGPLGGSDKATLFAALGDSLWRSVTTDLQTGNFPWTICGWVNLTSPIPTGGLSQQVFWGQWDTYGTTSGTNLYYDPTSGSATFCVDGGFPDSLSQGPAVTNTTLMNPSAGTWYFVLAEYDPVSNTLSHIINNNPSNRRFISPIQQPTPDIGKIGYGSVFQTNPLFAFGSTQGWDQPPGVNGSCHLYMRRNTNVSFGDNSFTVWGWFKCILPQSWPVQTLIGMFDADQNWLEWVVQLSASQLYFVIGNGGSTYQYITYNVTTNPNDWHLFVCWYDAVNKQISAVIDNGSPSTTSISPLTKPDTMFRNVNLMVGAATRGYGVTGEQYNGSLNAIGIARGNPSGGDLSALWNSGNGIVLGNPLQANGKCC